jgi:YVTN family beta-propeller protein
VNDSIGIVDDAGNGTIFASDISAPSFIVSNAELIPAISLDYGISGIAYNQYDGNMYVTNYYTNTTYALDSTTNTVTKNITVPLPDEIFYEPSSSKLYIISARLNTVFIVDPERIEDPIATNITGFNFSNPVGIAYDPVRKSIYIANLLSDTVYRLNGFSSYVEANISGFHGPRGIIYSPINGKVYVANSWNIVSSIAPDVKNIVKDIEISQGWRQFIAYNPTNGKVYVTSGNGVDIIDPLKETHINSIPLGSDSAGMAYNPSNGRMYVLGSSYYYPKVSVIEPYRDTVTYEITLPREESLQDISYNPSKGKMYVVNVECSVYLL